MKITKQLIYANTAALIINRIIVWLTIAKAFPVFLETPLVIGFIARAIWLLCYMNGGLPKQCTSITFYSAPTEKVEAL